MARPRNPQPSKQAKTSAQPASDGVAPAKLQKLTARGERRLLAAEQDAEQRLLAAQAKLAKAESRLAKRQAGVAKAAKMLRERQPDRSAGPVIAEV